ncbi:MAG TPA: hypothetical protein VJZ91_18530 [Blastocatellia bacterium]|nr:hypothetical protein [Blastocatellia bacterium]
MIDDLSGLLELVATSWPFDEANYPPLAGATDEQRLHFALTHVMIHQQKSLGALAALVDRADHGQPLDLSEAEPMVWKMLVNALRLAGLAGLSAARLAELIGTWSDLPPGSHPRKRE